MASTKLERLRALHEDIELLERAVVDELDHKKKLHKGSLVQQHRIAALVDASRSLAAAALTEYDDRDGSRAEEIDAMSGGAVFKEFYERLKGIREAHARNPGAVAEEPGAIVEATKSSAMGMDDILTVFSGEERLGRYLDLHAFHERYLNFRGVKRVDYVAYLEQVGKLTLVPRSTKSTPEYQQYVEDLAKYLYGFVRRTQPLLEVEPILTSIRSTFEDAWRHGKVEGWEVGSSGSASGGAGGSAPGKYCEPCGKLLSNENSYKSHLKGRKHRKNVERAAAAAAAAGKGDGDAGAAPAANGSAGAASSAAADADMVDGASEFGSLDDGRYPSAEQRTAWYEAVIARLLEQFGDKVEATITWIKRKLTMTVEEVDAEIEQDAAEEVEMEGESDSDSDSDEEVVYNPKNVPLGWDGKPIPYWLYKLHGLGIEYKCEICGNFSYWGRRAFDRHFQEARHAYNMRLLGIPNTKAFHDITSIEDAVNLHQKLKDKISDEVWVADTQEEYEDAAGNVVSKKTYDDLRREGLLGE